MKTLIINIGKLVGIMPSGVLKKEGQDMGRVDSIDNAYLLIDGEEIVGFGSMEQISQEDIDLFPNNPDFIYKIDKRENKGDKPKVYSFSLGAFSASVVYQKKDDSKDEEDDNFKVIDACYGYVLPSFCDSHTHIVYAGHRDAEFIDKIKGLSYEQIAQNGGGILNSADLLHQTTEEALYAQAHSRVKELMQKGTGAIEIKSGYGLNIDDELKMLRVIRRLKDNCPVIIRSTFLGAHAVGRDYKGRQQDYVNMVCEQMIPKVVEEKLADYIDVFCDEGFFTPKQTEQILTQGAKFGLVPKIHANELAESGGVQVGVKHKALSVDHLERTSMQEINALQGSNTMATMLPGSSFFLGIPYGNAKGFIDNGLGVALASDYNPGSSPSGDMHFIWALACIKMKLLPEQAFNAITINSAYAMGVSHLVGSITVGKVANLIITKPLPSLAAIPYYHHSPFIKHIIVKGRKL